jgi:hypothetical protein
MESNRGSIFEKKYIKVFGLGIVMLVLGTILIMAERLYTLYYDPDTSYEVYMKTRYTLSALSGVFLQLGMVLFSFSAFWGGVSDRTLSEEVRRGLVFASSMIIVALAIVMVLQRFFIF